MPASAVPAHRPRSWPRRVLIGTGVLAGLAVAAAGWIALTFDPDAWKPTLIAQVEQRYQRTLTLDGDIRISWLPAIGAEVGGVSLSERASSAEFAGAEQLRVSLSVLPLLRGRVVIRELTIRQPRATLVTRQDGSRNVDDLLSGAGNRAPQEQADPAPRDGMPAGISFDIGRIVIEKGRFTARDERSGRVLSLSALDLTTGRIGGNATEPFTLSTVVQSSDPKVDLRAEARGRLLVDLQGGRHGLGALTASLAGSAGGRPVSATLAAARLSGASRSLEVERLKLSVRQGDPRRSLSIELGLPSLQAVDGVFKGAALALVVDHRSGSDSLNLRAGLSLSGQLSDGGPGLARIEAPEFKADVEGRLGGRTVQGAARAQFVSDLQAGRHELGRYSLKATMFGLDAPVRDVTLAIDGAASAAGGGAASATAEGRLNETALRARLSRAGGDAPWLFDIEGDQFDLDRYRTARQQAPVDPSAAAAPAGQAPAAQPVDFGFLEGLEMAGAVRIGALRAAGMRAANVRIEVKAGGGRLEAAPIVASLYSGRLDGGLSLVHGPLPRMSIRQRLSGVQVGPLLADAAALELIEGRGDIRFDLSAEGRTVDALRRALAGSASVSLSEGGLRGVDIVGVLREAGTRIAELRGRDTRAPVAGARTDFTELRASFAVRDGVARSSDLSMKSPLLRAGGEGSIDIGAGTIDYLLRPTVVGTPGGLTVPVRINGPLARPRYDFDLKAMVAGAAGRPSPSDILKGVLGR